MIFDTANFSIVKRLYHKIGTFSNYPYNIVFYEKCTLVCSDRYEA